jgi:hypothetical protein
MMKRVIPLLILAVVLTTAPTAMAQCLRCPPSPVCSPAPPGAGFEICYYIGSSCIAQNYCGNSAAAAPLASEYVVASVERADDPQPNTDANETRIALLESKPAPKLEPAPAPDAHR